MTDSYQEAGERLDATLVEIEKTLADHDRRLEAAEENDGGSGAGGGFSRDEIETIVAEAIGELTGSDSAFDDALIERIRYHAAELDFPARRVGPAAPSGAQHATALWGIHFSTRRPCYIHSATVDASESGTFSAEVGAYDGDDGYTVVDETEITVDEGTQRVTLDLEIDDPGEYLLTRDGNFALRRAEWNGWDARHIDGLRLLGGSKPGDFEDNDFYYYFFDLEVTAGKDHEYPE